MKKLLIAYDGSPQADAAVDDLVHAGLPASLAATVLSVADVWLPSQPPAAEQAALASIQDSYNQALGAVQEALVLAKTAATHLQTLFPSWNVQAEARGDSPPWAVVEYAKKWNADLAVVGAHSHSALKRLFLGSVAGKVAAEAPCSVRISRPNSPSRHGGLRLLVAVDGSRDSVNAVRAVAERSWSDDVQCRVVTVLDPKLQTASAYPGSRPGDWAAENIGSARDWTGRLTEQMADLLREKGLSVEPQVREGDPKKGLLQEAEQWDADCIFLGARGLHHRDRLYLGTLANAVATRAPCTVEIVRTAEKPS